MLFYLLVGLILLFASLLAVIYYQLPKQIKCDFRGKHVFITGGSKGIGKAIATEVLSRGCRCVTIVARNVSSLESAALDLKQQCQKGQSVKHFVLDVSKNYDDIQKIILAAEKETGEIDILINNAGVVIQGGFDELEIDAFESQMKTNYLSLVYTTRAVIKAMKKRRSGHIAFVSSAAGQCSLWGYSAYSPSKFAIRAFADALHMELLPFNIGITVLYPPNTNTEGYDVELKEMPEQVREISSAAGIFSAEEVAGSVLDSIERGIYTSTVGFEGWMLGMLTAGASPEPYFQSALVQILLGGVFRGVMLFYLGTFNAICWRCHLRGNKE